MSHAVNNFFENLINSTNPQYAGQPPPVYTPTTSYLEPMHQSGIPYTNPGPTPSYSEGYYQSGGR